MARSCSRPPTDPWDQRASSGDDCELREVSKGTADLSRGLHAIERTGERVVDETTVLSKEHQGWQAPLTKRHLSPNMCKLLIKDQDWICYSLLDGSQGYLI